jgi:hypothetical protein
MGFQLGPNQIPQYPTKLIIRCDLNIRRYTVRYTDIVLNELQIDTGANEKRFLTICVTA